MKEDVVVQQNQITESDFLLAADQQQQIDKIIELVDGIYNGDFARENRQITLHDVLNVVSDVEEFLHYMRGRIVIEAVAKYIPQVVKMLGEKASQGNLEAAKLLLEISGLTGAAAKMARQPQVNVATSINLTMDEVNALKREIIVDANSS